MVVSRLLQYVCGYLATCASVLFVFPNLLSRPAGVHDELRALVRDMRDDLDTVTGRLRSLEADHGGTLARKVSQGAGETRPCVVKSRHRSVVLEGAAALRCPFTSSAIYGRKAPSSGSEGVESFCQVPCTDW